MCRIRFKHFLLFHAVSDINYREHLSYAKKKLFTKNSFHYFRCYINFPFNEKDLRKVLKQAIVAILDLDIYMYIIGITIIAVRSYLSTSFFIITIFDRNCIRLINQPIFLHKGLLISNLKNK